MIEIDKDIINRCRRKERKAQMQLYTTLSGRVYNTCYRILNDSFEAEDAMQECFLKILTNLDGYEESVPFVAWVTRIAINTSIDKLRRKSIETIQLNEQLDSHIEDESESEQWNIITAKVEEVKQAIRKLPDTFRLIISLYLIEGYDHEEIAEILNIKVGTSRIQYMRAKQKLLTILNTV